MAEGQKSRFGDVDLGIDLLADIRDGHQIAHQTSQLDLIASKANLFAAGLHSCRSGRQSRTGTEPTRWQQRVLDWDSS
jgi:hypothetical protein